MVRCANCMREYSERETVCPECAAPKNIGRKKTHHLQSGTVLVNKYFVGRAISEDNVSIKYLCYDENYNEKVYIYEYFPKDLVLRSKDESLIKFQTRLKTNLFEKSLNAYMDHIGRLKELSGTAGIEEILDMFIENNTCYVVCEYEEYVTLGNSLYEDGLYEVEDAAEIMEELITALDHLHRRGIVLGNISPEHIAIMDSGEFKFIDYGAASFVNSTGISMYNPIYSPPEAIGSKPVLTEYSDVYSIAALYYMMLSGVKPYTSTQRLRGKQLYGLRKLGINIKKSKEAALLNAMELSPKDRYKNAGELLKALNNRSVKRLKKNKTQKSINNLTYIAFGAVGGLCVVILTAAVVVCCIGRNPDETKEYVSEETSVSNEITSEITTAELYISETSTEETSSAVTTTTEETTVYYEITTEAKPMPDNETKAENTPTRQPDTKPSGEAAERQSSVNNSVKKEDTPNTETNKPTVNPPKEQVAAESVPEEQITAKPAPEEQLTVEPVPEEQIADEPAPEEQNKPDEDFSRIFMQ